MKGLRLPSLIVLGCSVAGVFSAGGQEAIPPKYVENFDSVKAGGLPPSWQVFTKLLMPGAIAPDSHQWQVEADAAAASKSNVLSVVKVTDPRGYSLCWTDAVKFKDGTLAARGRVNSAKVDGSSGVAWRIADGGNGYVVRYNSLEKNFRAYLFKDGKRTKLAEIAGIAIENGTWFVIKIVAKGDTFECTLNDLKPLVFTDATHAAAGGVGFYVKQDGMCSFDDLEVAGQ